MSEAADNDDPYPDMNTGVWFKSSVSGQLYRNHKSAGDIECVIVDGVWYDKSCSHSGYDFSQHGRCCHKCGKTIVDFGD